MIFSRAPFFLSILSVLLASCGGSSKRVSEEPLQTVERVDLDRYLGKWYEIARFPFSIQEGCFATTATYQKRSDGKIDVLNECRMGGWDGKTNSARGKAWIADDNSRAKLKVSFNFFMGLFGGGDYWIIKLADDYSYSVVSEPKGRFLWILSRSPQMDVDLYQSIVEDLEDEGFLVEYLQKTPQAL